MARLIRIEQSGPYKIEPKDFPTNGKAIFICGCGLSSRMPYCDGTHKGCTVEQPGVLYTYDPATKTMIGQAPDTPAPPPADPTAQ